MQLSNTMQASRLARSASRVRSFVTTRGSTPIRGSIYSTSKLSQHVRMPIVSRQPAGILFVRQFSGSSDPVLPAPRKRRDRFAKALKALQSAEYDDALEQCVKTLNKNTGDDSEEPEPIVPIELDVDSLGRPTGGADSGQDVAADILRQRRESARRNAMQNSSTTLVTASQSPNEDLLNFVKLAQYVGSKDKQRALILLADLFFNKNLSASAKKEVYSVMNADEAVEFYREASRANEYYVSSEALFKLGCVIYNGFDAQAEGGGVVEANVKAARVLIEEAAAKREPSAMFWMGMMFYEGDKATNIPMNQAKSLAMLDAAVQASHPGAAVYLGKRMLSGDVVDEMNGPDHVIEKGVSLLEMLVEHGVEGESYHAEALHLLADVYHNGTNTVDVNLVKSLSYYERACNGGACEACVSAGSMYFNSKGVPRDMEKAFTWYRRGAKLGSLEGWRNIAYMHMKGDGVPKDENLAKSILEHVKKTEMKRAAEELEKLEKLKDNTNQ